jgi:hypothetical protein
LWLAYQIVAAACTIVVGSAFVLAVVMLAVALCRNAASHCSSSSDNSSDDSIDQTMHFTLDSQPPGACVYFFGASERSAVTPCSNEWSYSLDVDGSGSSWSTEYLDLERGDEGYVMNLRCIVTKEGYETQILTQVLATVSHPTSSNDLPAQLCYTAVLKPVSQKKRRIGRAQLVNGQIIGITADKPNVAEGIYDIEIFGPETNNAQ